jgi:hypothetical protein
MIANLEPRLAAPDPNFAPHHPLPKADVVIFTWSEAGRKALAPDEHPWTDYLQSSAEIRGILDLKFQVGEYNRRIWPYQPWGSFRHGVLGGQQIVLFSVAPELQYPAPYQAMNRLTEHVLRNCEPSLVLSVGEAAALDPSHVLGDVLVSGSSYREEAGVDRCELELSLPEGLSEHFRAVAKDAIPAATPCTAHRLEPLAARRPLLHRSEKPVLSELRSGSFPDYCCLEPNASPLAEQMVRRGVPFGFVYAICPTAAGEDGPPEMQRALAEWERRCKGAEAVENAALTAWALLRRRG